MVIPYMPTQVVRDDRLGRGVVLRVDVPRCEVVVKYATETLVQSINEPTLRPHRNGDRPALTSGKRVEFEASTVVFHRLNGLGQVVYVDPERGYTYIRFYGAAPCGAVYPMHTKTIVERGHVKPIMVGSDVVRSLHLDPR